VHALGEVLAKLTLTPLTPLMRVTHATRDMQLMSRMTSVLYVLLVLTSCPQRPFLLPMLTLPAHLALPREMANPSRLLALLLLIPCLSAMPATLEMVLLALLVKVESTRLTRVVLHALLAPLLELVKLPLL